MGPVGAVREHPYAAWMADPSDQYRGSPLTPTRPEWQARAACRGRADFLALVGSTGPVLPAVVATCAVCPVRPECARYALSVGPGVVGVWGGVNLVPGRGRTEARAALVEVASAPDARR